VDRGSMLRNLELGSMMGMCLQMREEGLGNRYYSARGRSVAAEGRDGCGL